MDRAKLALPARVRAAFDGCSEPDYLERMLRFVMNTRVPFASGASRFDAAFQDLCITQDERALLRAHMQCGRPFESAATYVAVLAAINHEHAGLQDTTINMRFDLVTDRELALPAAELMRGYDMDAQIALAQRATRVYNSRRRTIAARLRCVDVFNLCVYNFVNDVPAWQLPRSFVDGLREHRLLAFPRHVRRITRRVWREAEGRKVCARRERTRTQRLVQGLGVLSAVLRKLSYWTTLLEKLRAPSPPDPGPNIVPFVRVEPRRTATGFAHPYHVGPRDVALMQNGKARLKRAALLIVFNRWSYARYRHYLGPIRISDAFSAFAGWLRGADYDGRPIEVRIDSGSDARRKYVRKHMRYLRMIKKGGAYCVLRVPDEQARAAKGKKGRRRPPKEKGGGADHNKHPDLYLLEG